MVKGVEGDCPIPGVLGSDNPKESERERCSNLEVGWDGHGEKRGLESLGQQAGGDCMTSNWMITALLLQNIGVAIASMFEGNWWRVLYWCGAACINTAILYGTRRI